MIATKNEITLANLEGLAKEYSTTRAELAQHVGELEAELAAAKRKHIARIKLAAAAATDAQARLRAAIEAAPHLFVQPRTFTLHGIKLGYQKGKGRLVFDEAQVIERITKHYPELVETAVRQKLELVKDALKNLDAKTLAKLGCTIEAAGDMVVIKTADNDIDKLVAALLDEGAKTVEEAA
jgi:hypothetical protein